MKPSILKTAFQHPGVHSCMPLPLFPLCLSHLWSSPDKALHLLLPTSAHLHHRAFTHPVLPHTPSSSSLCIHFLSTLQDPDEMLFLPYSLPRLCPCIGLLPLSFLLLFYGPAHSTGYMLLSTTFQVRLGALCGLDPSLTHL